MRFSSASLPLALSLLNLAQGALLEDHGYKKISLEYMDAVLPTNVGAGYRFLDIFAFYPWMDSAVMYTINDHKEPERKGKLSTAEIYNALAKERNINPEKVEWVIFEIDDDKDMVSQIERIRIGRYVDDTDEVVIYPGDMEWDTMRNSQYFKHATQVNQRAVEKIIVRTIKRKVLGQDYQVDCFHFYFPTPETKKLEGTASVSVNDRPKDGGSEWENAWKKELKKMWKVDWESDEAEEKALTDFLSQQEQQEMESFLALHHEVRVLFPELAGDVDSSSFDFST
ncbi:hypothetical protein HOO65_090235 [Ceratocystis lukuohia]|uniref:Uncharacterized protein n=1 Tax=Ceratocystis lukuohia TaxID=2019550 RepID=A0ABR4M9I6_9PEZI